MSANEMVIKNMDISNQLSGASNLTISIESRKKLDIINSNIGKTKEETTVSISSTNDFDLANSKIAGNEIKCQVKSIITDTNSSLTVSYKVDIITDDLNKINITSPTIIYNGNNISSKDESITLKKYQIH